MSKQNFKVTLKYVLAIESKSSLSYLDFNISTISKLLIFEFK